MRLSRFLLTAVLTCCLYLGFVSVGVAQTASLQAAKASYDRGDLGAATQMLQQIVSGGDRRFRAAALSNLAIIASKQGQTSTALQYWQTAAQLYRQIPDAIGEQRSLLRQAQALQSLGFYQKALDILETQESQLETQPDSLTKAEGYLRLGEMLAIVGRRQSRDGNRINAQSALEIALKIAQAISEPPTIAATQLALANYHHNQAITQLRRDPDRQDPTIQKTLKKAQENADRLYNQITGPTALRAKLNQMRLHLDLLQPQAAVQSWPGIQSEIAGLPGAGLPETVAGLELRINLIDNLIKLRQQLSQKSPEVATIQAQLVTAQQLATALKQSRLQAYIAMLAGKLSQDQKDLPSALRATDQGLFWAKNVNAPEILYRLYHQRGQILEAQGDRPGAIMAYKSAIANVKIIRSDIDSIVSETLVSFQNDVNPIHRSLVRLLLDNPQPSESALREARSVIESLQVAELNNFLGTDCLQGKAVDVEGLEAAQQTAIIYPIVLSDRLATIVSLPGKTRSLKLFVSPIAEAELNRTLQDLRANLADRIDLEAYKEPSQKVYDWLIRRMEPDLAKSQVKTLMFVLDGKFRNVPMAALSDGKQYLVEKYNLALTPGLQLADPKPLENRQLGVLAFGLSDKAGDVKLPSGQVKNFPQLPNVKAEIASIQGLVQNSQSFIDQAFTAKQFQFSVKNSTVPIVHMATHGEFSSDRDATFLLITDASGQLTTLGIDELSAALSRDELKKTPLELLILSACETATGDDRAALGIAGVALRSGARSTIASLWSVDDQATSVLMKKLYEVIKTQKSTRSEALKQAQLVLLQDSKFRHPYYWAPFVLVGNWL
jgi:CHAT domain-containing protein/predicted negative regulator of RcsB-dependent stress response